MGSIVMCRLLNNILTFWELESNKQAKYMLTDSFFCQCESTEGTFDTCIIASSENVPDLPIGENIIIFLHKTF